MSEKNVEVVKQYAEVTARGDFDTAGELVAEDVVVTWPDAPPRPSPRDPWPGEVDGQLGRVGAAVRRISEGGRGMDRCGRLGVQSRELGRHRKGSGARVVNRNVSAFRIHEGKIGEWIMSRRRPTTLRCEGSQRNYSSAHVTGSPRAFRRTRRNRSACSSGLLQGFDIV